MNKQEEVTRTKARPALMTLASLIGLQLTRLPPAAPILFHPLRLFLPVSHQVIFPERWVQILDECFQKSKAFHTLHWFIWIGVKNFASKLQYPFVIIWLFFTEINVFFRYFVMEYVVCCGTFWPFVSHCFVYTSGLMCIMHHLDQ